MPQRLQRRRTKGWRMPPGAVYVGRPTEWGNPFVCSTRAESVAAYRKHLARHPELIDRAVTEYVGTTSCAGARPANRVTPTCCSRSRTCAS